MKVSNREKRGYRLLKIFDTAELFVEPLVYPHETLLESGIASEESHFGYGDK